METSVAMAKTRRRRRHYPRRLHAPREWQLHVRSRGQRRRRPRSCARVWPTREDSADAGYAAAIFTSPSTTCKQAKLEPARFSINGLGYLLVEVPDYGLPPGLTETFYELQLAGLTPILTHPGAQPHAAEGARAHEGLAARRRADPGDGRLADRPQGQAGAAHGARAAGKTLGPLSRHRRAQHHFAARRACATRTTWSPRKFGASYAHALCLTNPLAVFLGKQFEVAEEPHGLYEEVKEPNWWQRVVGALTKR